MFAIFDELGSTFVGVVAKIFWLTSLKHGVVYPLQMSY